MIIAKRSIKILLVLFISIPSFSQQKNIQFTKVRVGAERTEIYMPLLKNKNVGIISNHSSLIGKTHLVDSLLSLKVKLIRIFSPEHGFRGDAADGELIGNFIDKKTGLEVVSLYGSNKKLKVNDLDEIDVLIFDIQDVGIRHYTYISTMHWVMKACADNNVQMIVFDRPNPNGFYIDGPVLEKKDSSFIGMHPVPLVHGMTIAEYAQMINGEGWLGKDAKGKIIKCKLKIITCENYDHEVFYELPVQPSPNLPNMNAVFMYSSLGLFEGTKMSIGRGTDFPFQVIGCPEMEDNTFTFIPKSIPGVSTNPKYKGITCNGIDLRETGVDIVLSKKQINLQWIIDAYNNYHEKDNFFTALFYKLSGNRKLKQQIIDGMDQESIRASWQDKLFEFKMIRRKYLAYTDFE